MSTRKNYWQKVLDTARQQLQEMRTERDEREAELNELNTEILQLERLLESLSPFTSEEPLTAGIHVQNISHLELADAIRAILTISELYVTPRMVRDSLKASDYDLDQHTNPLASVHSVLKRLVESGEVEQMDAKGKTYYRATKIGKLERAMRNQENAAAYDAAQQAAAKAVQKISGLGSLRKRS